MLRYSAVIIARNEEMYIKQAIESVLNQSIKPYQVVVVDDGSTDATPEILRDMKIIVKRIPHQDRDWQVYSNTIGEIRNAGLACVKDDPVDWIYSGDADIELPTKYCEIIMKHAEENNACVGAGTVGYRLDDLPTSSCQMIKHDWLKSNGMETKWASIYLSVLALVQGKNTLVRCASNCTVVDHRPERSNRLKPYNSGKLTRRMGGSLLVLLYGLALRTKRQGPSAGYKFLKGYINGKREVSKEMATMFNTLSINSILTRLKRHHKMLYRKGDNTICHPPNVRANQL